MLFWKRLITRRFSTLGSEPIWRNLSVNDSSLQILVRQPEREPLTCFNSEVNPVGEAEFAWDQGNPTGDGMRQWARLFSRQRKLQQDTGLLHPLKLLPLSREIADGDRHHR